MELQVRGSVKLGQGGATISLAPLVGPPPPRAAPPAPNPEMVATWDIHPSRKPITRDALTQAILLVQKQLGLASGIRRGTWSQVATERLMANLRKAKRGAAHDDDAARSQKKLCLEDRTPLLALQDAPSTIKPGQSTEPKSSDKKVGEATTWSLSGLFPYTNSMYVWKF